MAAQLNASLMTVSVIALVIPATFPHLSSSSSIVLILIYLAYLFFQFYSHTYLFIDVVPNSPTSSGSSSSRSSTVVHEPVQPRPAPQYLAGDPARRPTYLVHPDRHKWSFFEPHNPRLNTISASFAAVTTLTYLTAEYLVESVNGLVEHFSVNKEWIALIIISNAAEHTTAVVVTSKGKFDLAMSVAVGSCIQIALFVIPALVIVGGLDKPLTLFFTAAFEIVTTNSVRPGATHIPAFYAPRTKCDRFSRMEL